MQSSVRTASWSRPRAPTGPRVAPASDDGRACLWDTPAGRRLNALAGHAGVVWSAVFSDDGALLVTASDDGSARIWDTATGRRLHTLADHSDPVRTAVFS